MNDNQNYYVRPGRTTSRVLAPSGGQSSLTFGLRPTPTPAPPAVVEAVQPTPPTNVASSILTEEKLADENSNVTTETTIAATASTVASTESSSTTPTKFTSALLPSQQTTSNTVSQNAFVSGSNMNGGCVMTDRPSSRVLAPPGGHTSIKLG